MIGGNPLLFIDIIIQDLLHARVCLSLYMGLPLNVIIRAMGNTQFPMCESREQSSLVRPDRGLTLGPLGRFGLVCTVRADALTN